MKRGNELSYKILPKVLNYIGPKNKLAKNIEIKISYSNDAHTNLSNFARYKNYIDSTKPDLVVDGGDSNTDANVPLNKVINIIQRKIKLFVTVLGNHDLEGGDFWAKAVRKSKSVFSWKSSPKFLSTNTTFDRKNPVEKLISKSVMAKIKRIKMGFVGVSPYDFGNLTFINHFNDYIKVMDSKKTIEALKIEGEKLKAKGTDTICCLAHIRQYASDGSDNYRELAETNLFDVIFGGHEHKELDYIHTTTSGKKVRIISVGKAEDKKILGEGLDSFGELKMVFDKSHKLIFDKCENKVEITENYPTSKKVERVVEKHLKFSKIICSSDKELSCKNKMNEENPVASLAADAMLYLVNKKTKGEKAQIAFVNSGTVKGFIPKGDVTVGRIKEALPFVSSKLIKTTLTQKQIIDTLNLCAEAAVSPKVQPGIMQVGGMRYKIGKDNKVTEVYLLNKDGSWGERIDNQPINKKYTVIYDNFLMTGVGKKDGSKLFPELMKNSNDKDIEYFEECRQEALIYYLKSNQNILNSGKQNNPRIKVEKMKLGTLEKEPVLV